MIGNLPEKAYAVCFTGHRILGDGERAQIDVKLSALISALVSRGTKLFITGGALGFDTCAALSVLRARQTCRGVRLRLMIPCPDQDRYWTPADRTVYSEILKRADEKILVSPSYHRGCMLSRDRAMVDAADLCVAWLRPDETDGGTIYTVKYAEKHGVPVFNLYGS